MFFCLKLPLPNDKGFSLAEELKISLLPYTNEEDVRQCY